ncbi:hypothetical protein AB0L04_01080 [Streptomyces glaucescens]|uniref:hypothetical protein n=1 Tax=Streptomyces glaucescens TaxID=1907 RepID=UPI00344B2A8C
MTEKPRRNEDETRHPGGAGGEIPPGAAGAPGPVPGAAGGVPGTVGPLPGTAGGPAGGTTPAGGQAPSGPPPSADAQSPGAHPPGLQAPAGQSQGARTPTVQPLGTRPPGNGAPSAAGEPGEPGESGEAGGAGRAPDYFSGVESGRARSDKASHLAPLLPHSETDKLAERMRHAVAGFVDGPRAAVQEADQVMEEIAARFTEAMAERRRDLRRSWETNEEPASATTDTEQLRLALRDYRELADRLLHW